MRYVSTRGQAPVRDFAGVLLAGLAEDGGLYVPESWPEFSAADWRAMRGLPYAGHAASAVSRVLRAFRPPGRSAADSARREPMGAGAVPRADVRLQGSGAPA